MAIPRCSSGCSNLAERNAVDAEFIAESSNGFGAALGAARSWSLERVAEATGLSQRDIAVFYDWFAETTRAVTVYSQGVNQSATGTDKVNAIINVPPRHRPDRRPGMGPFSVTGQPNAMGGREVGGLANMLAAHMDFDLPASTGCGASGAQSGLRRSRG
jgi:assimilatory nitrate reductase catalytic subunit